MQATITINVGSYLNICLAKSAITSTNAAQTRRFITIHLAFWPLFCLDIFDIRAKIQNLLGNDCALDYFAGHVPAD
jgi:hypothetical protein